LPAVVFVPRRRRVLFVAGVATVGFMAWANTAANDRYLLAFYDLCIGIALAMMVKVWELGWLARLGLVPLVLLQLFWGGDAMFLYGKKELDAGIALIVDGYSEQSYDRLNAKTTQQQITRATPKNAVILSRNYKGLLGLDRLVLSDIQAAQEYISYSHLKDPRAFYDLLKQRGVTHLMYPRGDQRPGRWNNTLLFAEIFRLGPTPKRFGKLMLTTLASAAPPPSAPYLVLVTAQREYPDGIYKLEQLDADYRDPDMFTPRPKPFKRLDAVTPAEMAPQLSAVVTCRDRLPRGYSKELLSDLEQFENIDGCQYYLRKR
jgi:hypothetical protein